MPKKIRPSGRYRKTANFQTATIIYDATYWFCEKFIDQRSRTVDQMVQAARSGRQNIAEGSRRIVFPVVPNAAALRRYERLREAFIGLLQAHGVKRLVDVRSFPRSRRIPHKMTAWARVEGTKVAYPAVLV
jgi:restriction system protein